jgi:hypothetical protein
MTTTAQAREAIYQAFALGWGNRTPVCYGKEEVDPPNAPWVRVSVQHLSKRQVSSGVIGNRRFETTAQVSVQYFEPPRMGDEISDGHLREAALIFDSKRLLSNNLRIGEALPRELGIVEAGRWWAAIVEANFVYDEIR